MERIIHSPFSKDRVGFELSPRQKERYVELVDLAKEARAYPSQSGYFVRTAGLAKDGTICLGGNKEYAHSNAFVHGETAAISSLRDLTEAPIEAIAFYKPKKRNEVVLPEDFARPCGNCRDILWEYAGADLVLLTGNRTGIIYTRLEDFLFENFQFLDPSLVHDREVEEALVAQEAAIDVYLPEHLKSKVYGAVLVAEDQTTWRGSLYTNAGYDAVTPIQSAILHWSNSYPNGGISEKHLNLTRVVIAAKGVVPSPFYRDRQALLELDEILRRYRGDSKPLEVQLINYSDSGASARKTDAVECLPHPFTPGTFRMDDIIFAELAKLIGEPEARNVFEAECS